MKLRLARKILSKNNSNKANYWNGYTHSSIESFIFFSKMNVFGKPQEQLVSFQLHQPHFQGHHNNKSVQYESSRYRCS